MLTKILDINNFYDGVNPKKITEKQEKWIKKFFYYLRDNYQNPNRLLEEEEEKKAETMSLEELENIIDSTPQFKHFLNFFNKDDELIEVKTKLGTKKLIFKVKNTVLVNPNLDSQYYELLLDLSKENLEGLDKEPIIIQFLGGK